MLLDDFEPGLTTAQIDPIFADYDAFLPDFLAAVQTRQAGEPAIGYPRAVSVAAQEDFGRQIVQQLGFILPLGDDALAIRFVAATPAMCASPL